MMNDFSLFPDSDAPRRSVQVPLVDRLASTELSGDFSLPDYQPEIKRLLRIGVGILPPTSHEGAGNGTLDGTLDYYVLYMGHDNALWCAPLTTEYRLELPPEDTRALSAGGEPFLCLADVTTEPPTGRVTAPRRLSIKCRVNARVKIYGECLSGLPDELADEASTRETEALTATREVCRLYSALGELQTLQDDIILPPAEGGDWRVVCAEGTVMMTDAVPAEGSVSCHGEVAVKLTLCPMESVADDMDPEPGDPPAPRAPGMPLTVLQRKIPFSQSVDMEGVTTACSAMACGYCTDLSVEMEEGQVHIELGVLTEVRAQKNERVTYVKDLYSTRRDGTAKHATYPTECAARALNGNFTLSESMPLEAIGMDPEARVVDATATAVPESLTADRSRGRCVLTGTCRARLLLHRDGEYTAATADLPFRYEFDAPTPGTADTHDAMSFDGCVTVLHCRARADAERVAIDAELAVSLRTHMPAPMTALTEFTPGETATRRRGEYVICFPAPTDTLWSVAKRYHAPMAALTAANNLPVGTAADTSESLEGVGYLIV